MYIQAIHIYVYTHINIWDFTGGSDGKESACKVGDLDSIPGGQGDPLEKGMLSISVFLPVKPH